MFGCYEERRSGAGARGMHEDMVIEIPPEMSAEPDTYRGHEGARRYFAGFDGMLDDVRFEPIELLAGATHVLAHLRVGGRGASSGLDVSWTRLVVTGVRRRQDHPDRAYPDRAAAERAIAQA